MQKPALAGLRFLLFLLAPYFSAPSTVASTSQDLGSTLGRRVSNYSLGPCCFVEALVHVSNDFHVPFGITWILPANENAKISFAWHDVTLTQMIDNIVRTQQGYGTFVKDEVLHVFPPRDVLPDSQNFLKLKLPSFKAHDDFVELASFKLHTMVTPRRSGQVSVGGTGDSKVDLDLRDCTVEDALDAIAIASNRKIWIVTFTDDRGLTSRGWRRTSSLWASKPQPDEEQPGWDLLRWGG